MHNFKWSRDAIERMRTRYVWYKELHDSGSRDFGFYEEGKRLLDYLDAHGGRFEMADPRLEVVRDGRCLFARHPPCVMCACEPAGP